MSNDLQANEPQFCLIKTAFKSEEDAAKIAKILIDKGLIASGQLKPMRSLYVWKDEMCDESEIELNCFTRGELYSEVEQLINKYHPYELCQVVCLPIADLSEGFAEWIFDCTNKFGN